MSVAEVQQYQRADRKQFHRERRPQKILCRGVRHFFGFPVEPEVYNRNRKSSLDGSKASSAQPFRWPTRRAQVSLPS